MARSRPAEAPPSPRTLHLQDPTECAQPRIVAARQTAPSSSAATAATAAAAAAAAPSPQWLPRHACDYQACYCEENAYLLARELLAGGLGPGAQLFAVFVSNHSRAVPLWRQRGAESEGAPVVWDYHVFLVLQQGGALPPLVFDLDSTLPFPCTLADYRRYALLGSSGGLPPQFSRCYRVVPARLFLDHFASDRSHMRDARGGWLQPPPRWPPIVGAAAAAAGAAGGGAVPNTLPAFLAFPPLPELAAAASGAAAAAEGGGGGMAWLQQASGPQAPGGAAPAGATTAGPPAELGALLAVLGRVAGGSGAPGAARGSAARAANSAFHAFASAAPTAAAGPSSQPASTPGGPLEALLFWQELYNIARGGLQGAMEAVQSAYPQLAPLLVPPPTAGVSGPAVQLLQVLQTQAQAQQQQQQQQHAQQQQRQQDGLAAIQAVAALAQQQQQPSAASNLSAATAQALAAAAAAAGLSPAPPVLSAANLPSVGVGGFGAAGVQHSAPAVLLAAAQRPVAAPRPTAAIAVAQAPPLLTAVGLYSGGEATIDVATTSGRDWAKEAGDGSDGSQEGGPSKRARRGEAPAPVTGTFSGKVCSNCHTNSTPFWRKDRASGLPLCNACGLYAAKNDHPRPVKLWREGQSGGMQPSPQLQQVQQKQPSPQLLQHQQQHQQRRGSPGGAADGGAGAMQQAAAQLQLLQRGSASPQAPPAPQQPPQQQRQQLSWPPFGLALEHAAKQESRQAAQPAAASKEASLEPQPTLTPPAEQQPRSSPAQQECEPSTSGAGDSPPPPAAAAAAKPASSQPTQLQEQPPPQQQEKGDGVGTQAAVAPVVAALAVAAPPGPGQL